MQWPSRRSHKYILSPCFQCPGPLECCLPHWIRPTDHGCKSLSCLLCLVEWKWQLTCSNSIVSICQMPKCQWWFRSNLVQLNGYLPLPLSSNLPDTSPPSVQFLWANSLNFIFLTFKAKACGFALPVCSLPIYMRVCVLDFSSLAEKWSLRIGRFTFAPHVVYVEFMVGAVSPLFLSATSWFIFRKALFSVLSAVVLLWLEI
jgi:hypothetical protein